MRARTGQFAGVAALRSALHSYRTFTTRGRYFVDRHAGALRFCLAAERLVREGTRQGDALFPRASPLQKQSTGLFLNSPLAEGLLTLEISRSAERDQRLFSPAGSVGASQPAAERCPPDTRASGLCKPLKRLDLNLQICSPRLLFRPKVKTEADRF